MKQGLRAVAVVALLGLHPAIAAATVWNAVSDFSTSSNPNGAWTYGYGAAGSSFSKDSIASTFSLGPTDLWSRYRGDPVYLYKGNPMVAENMGATYNWTTVLVPTGVLWLHPGKTWDSLVQWTAPTAGTYSYSGEFELLDIHPTGIIGEVFGGEIGNARELYSGTLTGPGANQSTKTPGESETFSGTVSLLAGETLTFAVNNDGDYNYDSTGLMATITSTSNGLRATTASSVPEPSTWAMMLLGFAGLSFAACRRTITTGAAKALTAVVRFA